MDPLSNTTGFIPWEQLSCPMALLNVGTGPDRVAFPVHKELLVKNSPFFVTALNGPFQEGKRQVVPLPEDDPDIVYRMINWLYRGRVDTRNHYRGQAAGSPEDNSVEDGTPEDGSNGSSDEDDDDGNSLGSMYEEPDPNAPAPTPLDSCAGPNALFDLWIMGDKFFMPEMQNEVAHKLVELVSTHELYHCEPLPSVDMLQHVFDNTVEKAPLRALAIDIAVLTWQMEHIADLEETLSPEVFAALFRAAMKYWRHETQNHDPKYKTFAMAHQAYDVPIEGRRYVVVPGLMLKTCHPESMCDGCWTCDV
ncbi:btb poz domain containing protein [Diplodia corticola]|uniref:Btb poz domain containing protein n=1 Tax=Diplodia corticola TaxID=236234 RepID=A0A1J9SDJ6_9PEZI|nr:btb poz domain containing protein [Diplodia corticola]OJD37916.1 btb poz domain containing protein [Diplodia corticola]